MFLARRVFLVLLVGMPFATGMAQARVASDTGSALRLGDTVQALMVNPTDPRGGLTLCQGTIGALRTDTIYVTRSTACGPRYIEKADLRRLNVARGERGSRVEHLRNGMLVGGLLGAGVSAAVVAGSPCSTCDGITPALAAAGGGSLGALAGGVIGLLLPAGPRWLNVEDPPAIRIARYAVRPALHIAVR